LGVPHILGLKIVGGTVSPPPVDRKMIYRAPQGGDAAGVVIAEMPRRFPRIDIPAFKP
jgi:hypothetical protein